MLDKVTFREVRGALTAEELSSIIGTLIKECVRGGETNITVALNKKDVEKVEEALMAGLKQEMKKGITISPSEDVMGGFMISFDSGKSYYDFSDKALAEYIGTYVHPKLKELLKDASEKK
jgi:vacuolar-type H+-ATPase subunit E/Vma4